MKLKAAVGYYAGGIGKVASEDPTCPVQLHFGSDDDHIGKDQVDAVRMAHPDVEIFLYDGAGHAFANAARASYVPAAADLAGQRALAFLKSHIAK
jgi:carboxymethylenebutenolidase